MTGSRKQLIFRLGFLVLLVCAVYAPTLTHDFVWDDAFVIVNNPLLEHPANIPRLFLSEDTIEESTGYYRPVTYASFALERALWGVNPAGYHGVNLLLHLLVVLLLSRVIATLFRSERLAWITALVFALHPVAAETVNFLAGGRNTLLAACFGLLAFLFHLKSRPLPALAAFTLAIFSKEFALLFPALFLLADLRPGQAKPRGTRYLPYLGAIAGYLLLRSLAVQKANFLATINLSDAAAAPYLVVRYALNMLLPLQLKVLYSVAPGVMASLACLALIGAAAGACSVFRKNDRLVLAASWFLLFLLPVVNIIPLRTTTVLADRYAYFSLMGFALVLATVLCRLQGRALAATVTMLCAVYALVDVRHTRFWHNEVTLFTRMTEDAPDRFEGFKNLGLSQYRQGDIDRALESLAAADARPGIPVKFLVGDAYIFWKENRPDLAEQSLQRVVERNPSNPEPYLLLMLIARQKGDEDGAGRYRRMVQNLAGDIEEIMASRTVELCRAGETYLARRRYTEAETYLWQALRITPGFVPALIDMGSLKSEQGDFAAAIGYLGRAIALEPANSSAHHNLEMVYALQGRGAEVAKERERFAESVNRAERGKQRSPASP
jgi:tetratricopeptide (TPR) repeat protein